MEEKETLNSQDETTLEEVPAETKEEVNTETTLEEVLDQTGKKKKVKKNLEYWFYHERDKRGVIDIRIMKMIGWGLMMVTAFATGLSLFFQVKKITNLDFVVDIFQTIGSLSISALMIAAFSNVLQKQQTAIKQVKTYGIFSAIIIAAFYLLYFFYIGIAMAHMAQTSYPEALGTMSSFLTKVFGKSLKFNFFLDLFLFSLFTMFLFYTPEKLKNTKKRYIYRWMALLPVLYVMGCLILNIYNSVGTISMPVWVYPLLPTKSPLMFLSLCTVALIVKAREHRLLNKFNHSKEEYEEFFHSNSNSWIVAKTFAKCLLIFGILDFVISMFFTIVAMGFQAYALQLSAALNSILDEYGMVIEGYEEEAAQIADSAELVNEAATALSNMADCTGIGTAASQILFAPVVLFFSFNKPFKTKTLDLFVPIAGIGGMLIVMFNWIFVIFATL